MNEIKITIVDVKPYIDLNDYQKLVFILHFNFKGFMNYYYKLVKEIYSKNEIYFDKETNKIKIPELSILDAEEQPQPKEIVEIMKSDFDKLLWHFGLSSIYTVLRFIKFIEEKGKYPTPMEMDQKKISEKRLKTKFLKHIRAYHALIVSKNNKNIAITNYKDVDDFLTCAKNIRWLNKKYAPLIKAYRIYSMIKTVGWEIDQIEFEKREIIKSQDN